MHQRRHIQEIKLRKTYSHLLLFGPSPKQSPKPSLIRQVVACQLVGGQGALLNFSTVVDGCDSEVWNGSKVANQNTRHQFNVECSEAQRLSRKRHGLRILGGFEFCPQLWPLFFVHESGVLVSKNEGVPNISS